jgi:uncharacterized protein YlzI (FlbEa/FlbD family)
MRLIELTALKGGPVWVNPDQVLYAGHPDDGGSSSMYGENNVRRNTRLFFAQGLHVEVKEALDEVVQRLMA